MEPNELEMSQTNRHKSVLFCELALWNRPQKALTSSNRSVARELGVNEKRIREWRSQLPRFDELPGTLTLTNIDLI